MSQLSKIEKYLRSGRSLTSLQALNKFDCLRLGGRIHDLRKKGLNIKTDMITTKSGKSIAKYRIIK